MAAARLAAVLEGCRRHDERAWRELYAAHFEFLYRTARRLGTPDDEIEDVVHEVFLAAFRRIDTFAYGRLTTWLYRICANIVASRHRRRRVAEAFKALAQSAERAPPETPERTAARSQSRRAVERILCRMAPKRREVLALFELEGLSGEEIAERVGCPVDTVWTRLHHARKEFSKIARKLGYLEPLEVS